MKKQIIIALLLFFSIERCTHSILHGFSMHKVRGEASGWDVDAIPTDETLSALSQPYKFLDRGGESYAFVSKDGKYVLKLFKMHHMRPSLLSRWVRPWREKKAARYVRFFTSCSIVWHRFRKETGLVHLQLNQTDQFADRLTIYDPIGVIHKIDLNTIPFALQRKADLLYPTIDKIMANGNTEGAANRLASLLRLIDTRNARNIVDNDPRGRNFGFIDEEAIEIDIGSFSEDPYLQNKKKKQRSLFFETIKLRRWIRKYHPELLSFFEREVANRLGDAE